MYNDVKEEFCSIAIKESSDLIDKVKEHPFNVELINNTLDYEKFKFYLQQDFLYCIDCARAFLIVADRVDDIEIMSSLIDISKGAFDVREQYKKYFEDCDLSDDHKKSRACSAFTDFLMSAAYHNSVAEALTVSCPCFNIYQIVVCYMVNEMATKEVKNSKYKKWINIYSGKTINAMMDEVTNITNMLYKKASNCEKKRMYEFFRKGLELEIMFWDEAYYSKYTSIKAH